MTRFKFPPRAYGPYTESFTLPQGAKGRKRYEYYSPTSSATFYDLPNGRQHVTTVSRTGVRRKKPPALDPSPYRYVRTDYDSSGAYKLSYVGYANTSERSGALWGNHGVLPAEQTNAALKSSAEVSALLKLKAQSVNLGVAFAERSRTAALVTSSIGNILASVFDFRRGDISSAFKRLKRRPPTRRQLRIGAARAGTEISQQWLALQYGWTPLMNDVYGSCEALANRELLDFAVRVKSRKQIKTAGPEIWGTGNEIFDAWVEREISYHVALNYMPTDSLLSVFTQLGLTNPAEIAWELVPFSFVADWFIPIGSWLSSLDAAAGWSYSSGTCTKRTVATARANIRRKTGTTMGSTIVTGDASLHGRRFVVDRTLYPSSPIPGRPGMKDPRSLKHMANAMALLVSVFKGSGAHTGVLGSIYR